MHNRPDRANHSGPSPIKLTDFTRPIGPIGCHKYHLKCVLCQTTSGLRPRSMPEAAVLGQVAQAARAAITVASGMVFDSPK